jgi:hypothetical protein
LLLSHNLGAPAQVLMLPVFRDFPSTAFTVEVRASEELATPRVQRRSKRNPHL